MQANISASGKTNSLCNQIKQVSDVCAQLKICWCPQYPTGNHIADAVRTALSSPGNGVILLKR